MIVIRKKIILICIAVFLCCQGTKVNGQFLPRLFTDEHDSTYIESYKHQLTTRMYASRKYTDLKFRDRGEEMTLNYHPNDRTNLGFGATYNALTLNIGISFPLINHDDGKYGKTDYLDWQMHILMRKLAVDFYFSTYKGYYIYNPQDLFSDYTDDDVFPQRRDMLTIELGGDAYYIFNYRKFSYRAAFNQDERQLKSAGSFLAGPSAYFIYFQGDSSLVPANLADPDFFDGYTLKRSRYNKFSLCAGYAYNLIVKQRVFFTVSILTGAGAGLMRTYPQDDDIEGDKKFDVCLTYTFKCATGYNGKHFYAGISYVNSSLHCPTPVPQTKFIFDAGNLRLNLAYRFPISLNPPFPLRKQ